ncbi:MAG TPA: serine/threonine-protein kinase, partial [Pirellulaceae bacterium]|nr:serine/threonine-protein kinase [Pirellulaceae bacterium]
VDIGRLVAVLGPLPCPAACEIIRQAALGLAHVHACGLVHRDLKPSNLMLASDGVVKILDLGLARLREGQPAGDDSQTQSGYLLGTADYVSPEQLHDPHDADVRSDLYSLGCTFYKLLAGQAPYCGTDPGSIGKKLDAHRYAAIPSVRSLRPEIPEEVDAILARLLAKEPENRFQQPADLAESLAPWTADAELAALCRKCGGRAEIDEPLRLPPSIAPEDSTRPEGQTPTPHSALVPQRRRRWPLAVAAAGGLAAILVIAWIVANWDRGDKTSGGGRAISGLDAIPTELPLPDAAAVNSLQVNQRMQTFDASAQSMQLVRLGELERGKGSITFDLQFVADYGDAGLFLGYHEDLIQGHLWGIADFVYLATLPRGTKEKFFAFKHYQAQVRPGNRDLYAIAESPEVRLPEGDRKFRLVVDFAPQGLTAIKLNGQPYPTLLKTGTLRQFQPESIWGPWGIYNNGSTIRVSQPALTKEPL